MRYSGHQWLSILDLYELATFASKTVYILCFASFTIPAHEAYLSLKLYSPPDSKPQRFSGFFIFGGTGYIEPIESAPKQNEEVHRQEKRGRRPVVYRAKADARYVLGIEFHVERILLGVFDFLGNQLYARDVPLNKTEDALAVVHIIVDLASEAISHLKLDKTRIS